MVVMGLCLWWDDGWWLLWIYTLYNDGLFMMVFMVLFWEWDDDYSMVIIGIIPIIMK